MARGEMKPRVETKSWVWHKVIKNGEEIDPEPQDVRNKYIRACIKNQKNEFEKIANGELILRPNGKAVSQASFTARPNGALNNNVKKNGLFPLNTHR